MEWGRGGAERDVDNFSFISVTQQQMVTVGRQSLLTDGHCTPHDISIDIPEPHTREVKQGMKLGKSVCRSLWEMNVRWKLW